METQTANKNYFDIELVFQTNSVKLINGEQVIDMGNVIQRELIKMVRFVKTFEETIKCCKELLKEYRDNPKYPTILNDTEYARVMVLYQYKDQNGCTLSVKTELM